MMRLSLICLLTLGMVSLGYADKKPAAKLLPAIKVKKVIKPVVKKPVAKKKVEKEEPAFLPTHKQTRSIRPKLDGDVVRLNSFCLDSKGYLWSAVSVNSAKMTGAVIAYDTAGKAIKVAKLDFVPTAINMGPDGTIFTAGSGKVARVSAAGKVLFTGKLPSLKNTDELKAKIREQAKEQAKRMKSIYERSIQTYQKRIDAIKETPEDDRTKLQENQLKSYERIIENYKGYLKRNVKLDEKSLERQVKMALSRRGGINGICATKDHVYVSANTVVGYGYDIWKCKHDLSEGEVVIEKLRGCCGRMDIQTDGKQLFTAENTKFRVGIYNLDGKETSAFGKRAARGAKGEEGWGSCCNPMNVRCCEGDILVAESSIGKIKRYSKDGKLLAYIGKAKIGGGCKNVALAHDKKLDRYYMMNVQKNTICVLVPLSEAPEFTEDELLAKKAAEGLGKKLPGTWVLAEDKKKKPAANGRILGYRSYYSFTFGKDNSFSMQYQKGQNVRIGAGYEQTWKAVRQEGTSVLEIVIVRNDVEGMGYKIDFKNNNTAEISMLDSYGKVRTTATYNRQTEEKKSAKTGDEKKPAASED